MVYVVAMHINGYRVFGFGGSFADQGPTFIPTTLHGPIVVSVSITKVLLASFFPCLPLAWPDPLGFVMDIYGYYYKPGPCIKSVQSVLWGASLVKKFRTLLWMWMSRYDDGLNSGLLSHCTVWNPSQSCYCQSHATYSSTLLRLQTPWTPQNTRDK